MSAVISKMTVARNGDVEFDLGTARIGFPRSMHNQSDELSRFLAHNAATLLDVTGEETASVRLTYRAEIIKFRDPKLTTAINLIRR